MDKITKYQRLFISKAVGILDCTMQNERQWQEVTKDICMLDDKNSVCGWRKGVELKFEYICFNKLFMYLFKYGVELAYGNDDENLVYGIIIDVGKKDWEALHERVFNADDVKRLRSVVADEIREMWKLSIEDRFSVCCETWRSLINFSNLNKILVALIEEYNLDFNYINEDEEEKEDEDEDMENLGDQTTGKKRYRDSGDEDEYEEIQPKKKKRKKSNGLTIPEAIAYVLQNSKTPMHLSDIAKKIISQKLFKTLGKSFERTVGSIIYTNIKNYGTKSDYVKTDVAMFEWNENRCEN